MSEEQSDSKPNSKKDQKLDTADDHENLQSSNAELVDEVNRLRINKDTKDDDDENFSESDSEDERFVDALDDLVKNNEASRKHMHANTKQTLQGRDSQSNEEDSDRDDVDKNPKTDDVIVDDVALQEMEDSLTDEEKLERKEESQKLKTEGNMLFKSHEYEEAANKYTEALQLCPRCFQKERSIMFSNRAACRLHLEETEAAIDDCSKAVELNPNYLKALLRRAELYEKTEKLDEALEDYQKVVTMDPSQHSARQACMRLPDQIKERNEKLKEEMLGKLKDLGNMVLKPFGLSTENFKLQQDPNTGGYSVSFQQGGQKK